LDVNLNYSRQSCDNETTYSKMLILSMLLQI